MKLYLTIAALFFIFSHPAVAGKKPAADAPAWTWVSPDWNLDTDDFKKVDSKFGPTSSWFTGDGICSQSNQGYQFEFEGKVVYLVFYEGMDEGYRITSLKERSSELGGSDCHEDPNPKKTKAQALNPPFKNLLKTFRPPVTLGTSTQAVLEKFKDFPFSVEQVGRMKMYTFRWETTGKPPRSMNGDAWDIQTLVYIGFVNDRVEYLNVSRMWQD